MPYTIRGDTVVKADSGKVVGHSKNPKKYKRVLQAIEHGWKPSHKQSKHRAYVLRKHKGKSHGKA